LADPKYPPSKAWLYLACAVASDDKLAVARLLQGYETLGDELARRAAKEFLNGSDFAKQD